MCRVWRLGQEESVKVLFPVCADTMESAALALMCTHQGANAHTELCRTPTLLVR